MSLITQSITVEITTMTADGPVTAPQTWDVEFDDAQAVWLGADAAVDMAPPYYFDSSQHSNGEDARRIAIAKYLGGPLPDGAS